MSGRRAQSEVVAVVLLVLVVLVGSTLAVAWGGAALADDRQAIDAARAQGELSHLDSSASDVAFGFDARGGHTFDVGRLQTTDGGWLRVRLVDPRTGATAATVTNASLGAVRYRDGSTTIAYQGGGVWRADRHGSVMVSRPEFHFQNRTLTLPVVTVAGDRSLTGRVRVARDGDPARAFPDPAANLTNRIEDAKVRVTVHSDYYRAWGRYFAETTRGVVGYDHGAETVTVTFLALPTTFGLNAGIIATSGSGEIRLGGNSIYIDSYNSSLGTGRYVDTKGANGSITAVNDVVATGTSNVLGDLRSGATVDLSGTTNVSGTVYWTDAYEPDGASVNGGNESISGVATVEPIDGHVERTVERARTSNDNDAAAVISAGELAGSGSLDAGTYYLENLTVGSGETLTLNTSNGDVSVAVSGAVSVIGKGTQDSKAARIDVVGNGTARVYVVGDGATDLEVGKNGRVDVPAERSGQFRVYGTRDLDAVLTSDKSPAQIRFEGVIFAPAGYTVSGATVIGQARFFGAIVTGNLSVKQGAEIHYDRGLATDAFPRSPTVSRLDFLHVAVHPVAVTDE